MMNSLKTVESSSELFPVVVGLIHAVSAKSKHSEITPQSLLLEELALDSLDRALAGSDSTRGIAEARTVLLDLEALLADGRFEAVT